MKLRWLFVLTATLLAAALPVAQEREDRTLLTHEQMTAIINEASGERAMHHVLELVPYQRVRPPVEYEGNFRRVRGHGALREGNTASATSRSRSSA